AQPLGAQPAPAKDLHGDPLPPGAFARLGAARFRVSGPVIGARFVDGGKKLLVRVQTVPHAAWDDKGTFNLFDWNKGLMLGRSESELNRILGHWFSSSNNGFSAEGITYPNWCISPDATLLASTGGWHSHKLQMRELATGKVL